MRSVGSVVVYGYPRRSWNSGFARLCQEVGTKVGSLDAMVSKRSSWGWGPCYRDVLSRARSIILIGYNPESGTMASRGSSRAWNDGFKCLFRRV